MTKKELLTKIESFDGDSEIVFVADRSDLFILDREGADINEAAEINNGRQKLIVLME